MGCKKHAPQALKEVQKVAMKETEAPDAHPDTRLNKAVWAKGTGMSHTVIRCGCPENIMRMKIHQTSSILTKNCYNVFSYINTVNSLSIFAAYQLHALYGNIYFNIHLFY